MLQTILNVVLILLIIGVVVMAVLYFLGSKLQKRQLEQEQLLEAAAQTVSLLVIDKKKVKMTQAVQAGLPKMVLRKSDRRLSLWLQTSGYSRLFPLRPKRRLS